METPILGLYGDNGKGKWKLLYWDYMGIMERENGNYRGYRG